jgi:hypothetical protein
MTGGTVVADDTARAARVMWTLFEPIHAVCYFTAEVRSAFEEVGLRGFWRGYFAARAAPLGPAGAAVVTASFYNFAPAMVARALPGVWQLISPDEALRVRSAAAAGALHGLLAGLESEAEQAADLLGRVIDDLDCAGRVLAAGNAALPVPDDHLARLWQAATVLREHRGDGHAAALLTAGIGGCEALVLRCGLDLRREDLQPARGWTDEQWEHARARLAGQGLIGPEGELTEAGRDTHRAVEDATDRAAAGPWARLGAGGVAEVAATLDPLARACGAVIPYPSPIGVPVPGTAG